MLSQDILIVDDEVGIRELLSEILQDEGYTVALAENAAAARKYRHHTEPRLVLLDIWMPDTDGVTLLKEWARNGQLTMPIIMMSGHATIDTAVDATRIGAMDFLEKPIGLQKLLSAVKRGLAQQRATQQSPVQGLSQLGEGPMIQELQETLNRVVGQKVPILLTGQTGCGFEICARYLTEAGAPFVAPHTHEDLALAPQELLNKATGGTLFLRDIAYLGHKAQRGLVTLLPKTQKNQIRLVTASSVPLNQLADLVIPGLFEQLSRIIVPIPALADRPGDIPLLAEALLARATVTHQLPKRVFTSSALQLLSRQSWPGNLEQLTNVVKSLAITSRDSEIDFNLVSRLLSQFSPTLSDTSPPPPLPLNIDLDQPLREARDQFERLYLERQIEIAHGNMSRVAERSGLERTHLYRKLKQLGVQMPKKGRALEER